MLVRVELRPIEEPGVEPEAVAWRVDRRLTIAKWTGAAVFALAALLGATDVGQLLLAGFGAVLLAAIALRDTLVPVRLAADPAGVTVTTGFAGRRRLTWDQIEKIAVDARRGLLVRSRVLEVDAGDQLYFFGPSDLSVQPEEAAERLDALRAARRRLD